MEDENKSAVAVSEDSQDPKNNVKDQMYWWLNYHRPFFIGDEYKIELSKLDRKSGSAKIVITNLKTVPDPESIFSKNYSLTKDGVKEIEISDLLSMFSGEISNADEP